MGKFWFFKERPPDPVLESRLWWEGRRFYFGHYREEFDYLASKLGRVSGREVRCIPDVPGRCVVLKDRLVGTLAKISVTPISGNEPPVIVSVATMLPPSLDIWFQTAFLGHQVKIRKLDA